MALAYPSHQHMRRKKLKPESCQEIQRNCKKLQNNMLRVIFGLNLEQQVNMETLRDRIKMFSVNQLAIYHTIMEAFKVVRKPSTKQVKR